MEASPQWVPAAWHPTAPPPAAECPCGLGTHRQDCSRARTATMTETNFQPLQALPACLFIYRLGLRFSRIPIPAPSLSLSRPCSLQPASGPGAAAGGAGAPADAATEEAVRYLLQRLGLPRVLQAFEAEWCGRAH